MYTYSSYSRGAMLRRQCDSADIVRGLFKSKSLRNLSAASVLHIDEKTVNKRDGFLTWLKDIFNKSAENKSHKANTAIVDRAATATTFNRSEIAAPMRLVNCSDKVDVVNQKPANFYAARSTTKFEYGNIRAEKRDAENSGRAYTIQQSAIYTTSQSNHFAAEKTFERGIEPDSSWRDPGKMYRSERNGGAIEFVARDDLDVASHYRCYTSPRHCYRLPPQRTKQPLLGLCVPNRYINVPTRTFVGFAPRNTKPPIKEPNVPEKREKKDEKKDKKEKKKPVIRTNGESVDSSENRAEMVADDNPKSDPDEAFRYEWGVKLAEEQPIAKATSDNDKFAEKGQQCVTKRLWGVNLKQPDIAPSGTASSGRGTAEPQTSSNFKSGDITDETKSDAVPASNDLVKKLYTSNLKGTTADYLSTPSRQIDSNDNFIVAQDSDDMSSCMNSEELRKILRTSPNMLKETIVVDEEYNVPEGAGLDTEIIAWRNLVARSISEDKDNYLSTDNVENLEMVSIRPEPPQPKLDVRVVRSIEDNLKDKEQDSGYTSAKSIGVKRVGSPRRSSDKKLHTMSAQIRYMHTNNITQRHIGSLSNNFTPLNRTTQKKYPGVASAFSTNSEDSMPKKVIDEASKNKQQMDSKSQNKRKSNDSDSNNTPNRSLLSAESRRLSNSDQEQADAELAKSLAVIANKEMEISMKRLQSTDHKKIAHLSDSVASSGFTQKDKSHNKDKDIQDEAERYTEESRINYTVDFNNQATNSDSVKSTKRDSSDNATSDSNVKDADDNSKEYIIDGDYVRLPGDPYPYSRENLDKWHVPRSRSPHKPWKREMSRSSDSSAVVRSTLKNANDAYANAAGEPHDSHAGNAIMEISESDGDGDVKKRIERTNGFHVSSRDQRVVSDCLRGDAADALGLRQWTEAFSRFDVGEKINEEMRSGDNSFRARYE